MDAQNLPETVSTNGQSPGKVLLACKYVNTVEVMVQGGYVTLTSGHSNKCKHKAYYIPRKKAWDSD